MWSKGKTFEDVVVIGEEGGGLYKLKENPKTTLVHETTISSELWHRRLAHINYKALPYVSKMVLPPKLYLVVFYQVSLVNRIGITCSDFIGPMEVLL